MTQQALYESEISQHPKEIDPFIDILNAEGVKSFLEIGSRYGGSLWRIANALPVGSRIVSIDSGSGMGGNKPGAIKSLADCRSALWGKGYNAHVIWGDSHDRKTIDAAAEFGPFHAVFIDGGHQLEDITLDWFYYGRHAKRICGFHDIAWKRPEPYAGKLVDCRAFWDVIKFRYRSQEFVRKHGNMGIGVLWMKERYR